uniref:Uncharacterized protein n=1 Tax=Octopus bimaculoides TaxID=37653 RepID=A0A0L8GKS5_OCTBM
MLSENVFITIPNAKMNTAHKYIHQFRVCQFRVCQFKVRGYKRNIRPSYKSDVHISITFQIELMTSKQIRAINSTEITFAYE